MSTNQNLQDAVKRFVDDTMIDLNIDQDSDIDQVDRLISPILEALEIIINEYTVQKYEFTLAMDVFVEMAHPELERCLEMILDGADFSDKPKLRLYFAVYYALSIVRKKNSNTDGLYELLDSRYSRLRRFPLYFEVRSRYYKRIGMFEEALDSDSQAIDNLDEGIVNVGLLISYASTVCKMLRGKHHSLEDEQIENAFKYIEEAIVMNPMYPKYPFVKAKLIFLSEMRSGGDLNRLKEAQKQSLELIKEAKKLLYKFYKDQNNYEQEKDYEEFKQFMDKTISNLRYPIGNEELDLLKSQIMAASSHKECSSSDKLPPNPSLKPGDKYFFICYSSIDFKSVYSDLIEMYKRKVHFMYDRRLDNDVDWEGQVAEKINCEDCLGVAFYISQNILSGDAVYKEINLAVDSGKDRFIINLEEKAPSMILIDYIIKKHEDPAGNPYLPGKHMQLFLTCFNDSKVFVDKLKKFGDCGAEHMQSYIDALTKKFSSEIIGD